jgi:hypothetical protein
MSCLTEILAEDKMKSSLNPYADLMEAFIHKKIAAVDFERQYLELFKLDNTAWSDAEFVVLDRLFAAVDAFCADPSLRDSEDLDEEQLRQEVQKTFAKLKTFRTQGSVEKIA